MYEHPSSHRWSKHWDFILIDIIGFQLSFIIAYWFRHGIVNPYALTIYRRLGIVLALLTIVVAYFGDIYHGILVRDGYQEFKSISKHVIITVLLLMFYVFTVKIAEYYSRSVLFLLAVIAILLLTPMHWLRKKALLKRGDSVKHARQVLLVTTASDVEKIMQVLDSNPHPGLNLCGIVMMDSDAQIGEQIHQAEVVAGKGQLLDYINSNVVDEILVTDSAKSLFTAKMLDNCIDMGVTVHSELYSCSPDVKNQVVEQFAGLTVLSSSMKVANSRQMIMKRLMDIAGALVGSVLAVIAIVLCAPIILIQSPGPILFKQTRIGKNGRHFTIYKIRTMYTDAEARKAELMGQNKMTGLMFKMDDDPRIYPFGKFLRKYSIDELPQFFNVLKGDMSLVGTRPPTLDEYEQYEYHHQKRLSIKPGITGLWQVSGRSEITDFDEVVALDAQYISNWHIGEDVQILLKTIAVVLKHEGAE